MSDKEDLSEVTVSQTAGSWQLERAQIPGRCESRCFWALLLLLFLTIVSLVGIFWLLIYPELATRGPGDKFAAHLAYADTGHDGTVTWSATPGLGLNHLGNGFHFENQQLQTTRDGMYFVYAKLTVSCAVLNQCKNSSLVKLDITHCSENDDCFPILSIKVRVPQVEQQRQVAFDYSSTLVQISSKNLIRAKIEGLKQGDNLMPDIDNIYFGAILIGS
ncbi:uncharacterized protein LOC119957232 [Scyliorhinus canicula]|nr:uncharacterized protein LOC119957232 [Scyliorhinus canicula]